MEERMTMLDNKKPNCLPLNYKVFRTMLHVGIFTIGLIVSGSMLSGCGDQPPSDSSDSVTGALADAVDSSDADSTSEEKKTDLATSTQANDQRDQSDNDTKNVTEVDNVTDDDNRPTKGESTTPDIDSELDSANDHLANDQFSDIVTLPKLRGDQPRNEPTWEQIGSFHHSYPAITNYDTHTGYSTFGIAGNRKGDIVFCSNNYVTKKEPGTDKTLEIESEMRFQRLVDGQLGDIKSFKVSDETITSLQPVINNRGDIAVLVVTNQVTSWDPYVGKYSVGLAIYESATDKWRYDKDAFNVPDGRIAGVPFTKSIGIGTHNIYVSWSTFDDVRSIESDGSNTSKAKDPKSFAAIIPINGDKMTVQELSNKIDGVQVAAGGVPAISVNNHDEAIIVWTSQMYVHTDGKENDSAEETSNTTDTDAGVIWAVRSTDGKKFGKPESIGLGLENGKTGFPTATMTESGTAFVTWLQYDKTNTSADNKEKPNSVDYWNHYHPDTGWANAKPVHADGDTSLRMDHYYHRSRRTAGESGAIYDLVNPEKWGNFGEYRTIAILDPELSKNALRVALPNNSKFNTRQITNFGPNKTLAKVWVDEQRKSNVAVASFWRNDMGWSIPNLIAPMPKPEDYNPIYLNLANDGRVIVVLGKPLTEDALIFRSSPVSTGWKKTAADQVHTAEPATVAATEWLTVDDSDVTNSDGERVEAIFSSETTGLTIEGRGNLAHTWSGDIRIRGNLTLITNKSLHVAAGTHIRFDPGSSLTLKSDGYPVDEKPTVHFEGTAARPIVIQAADGQQAGSWKGLDFSDTAPGGVFEHLHIEGAGQDNTTPFTVSREVNLSHIEIRHAMGPEAINIHSIADGTTASISISDFQGRAVRLASPENFSQLALTVDKISEPAVSLTMNEASSQPDYRLHLKKIGSGSTALSTFYLSTDLLLAEGHTFVVDPGVTLQIAPEKAIKCDSCLLQLKGSASEPVTISGTGVQPWFGIDVIAAQAGSLIANTIIRGGGAEQHAALSLRKSKARVEDIIIEGSTGTALLIDQADNIDNIGQVDLRNNTLATEVLKAHIFSLSSLADRIQLPAPRDPLQQSPRIGIIPAAVGEVADEVAIPNLGLPYGLPKKPYGVTDKLELFSVGDLNNDHFGGTHHLRIAAGTIFEVDMPQSQLVVSISPSDETPSLSFEGSADQPVIFRDRVGASPNRGENWYPLTIQGACTESIASNHIEIQHIVIQHDPTVTPTIGRSTDCTPDLSNVVTVAHASPIPITP